MFTLNIQRANAHSINPYECSIYCAKRYTPFWRVIDSIWPPFSLFVFLVDNFWLNCLSRQFMRFAYKCVLTMRRSERFFFSRTCANQIKIIIYWMEGNECGNQLGWWRRRERERDALANAHERLLPHIYYVTQHQLAISIVAFFTSFFCRSLVRR